MVAHVGEDSNFDQQHQSVKLPSSICCLSTSRPPEGTIGRFRQLAPPPQTGQDESFRKFKPYCPRCCIRRFLTDAPPPQTEQGRGFLRQQPTSLQMHGSEDSDGWPLPPLQTAAAGHSCLVSPPRF